jgi:hypothetical protein
MVLAISVIRYFLGQEDREQSFTGFLWAAERGKWFR